MVMESGRYRSAPLYQGTAMFVQTVQAAAGELRCDLIRTKAGIMVMYRMADKTPGSLKALGQAA